MGQMKETSRITYLAGRILSFVIALSLFFGIFYLFAGKPFFSNKSDEYARRMSCQQNLRLIADTLESSGLRLEEVNVPAIENVITQLNLRCSSGLAVHTEKSEALYSVFRLPDGHIVISENAENHDPNILKHIDCRYLRYCLYERQDDSRRIEPGLWRDKNMVFDKIQLVNNDLN
jgi:hypothetical protein